MAAMGIYRRFNPGDVLVLHNLDKWSVGYICVVLCLHSVFCLRNMESLGEEMKIIICDRCEGYGLLEYDIGCHNSKYITEICGKCAGSGRLIQTIKTTNVSFQPSKSQSKRIF